MLWMDSKIMFGISPPPQKIVWQNGKFLTDKHLVPQSPLYFHKGNWKRWPFVTGVLHVKVESHQTIFAILILAYIVVICAKCTEISAYKIAPRPVLVTECYISPYLPLFCPCFEFITKDDSINNEKGEALHNCHALTQLAGTTVFSSIRSCT